MVSITQAKNSLSDMVNRAAHGGEWFLLLSWGKPKAAVVSVEELMLLESLREDREARKAEQAAWLAQADALVQEELSWVRWLGDYDLAVEQG